MERVMHQGEADRPTVFFNDGDLGLLMHYSGEFPEDFSLTIIATDELDAGDVALDNVGDLSHEAIELFSDYWRSGVAYAHVQAAVEVELAKRELAEDTPVMAVMGDDMQVAVVTVDDIVAAATEDEA